jgi:hypothetical protein
MEWVRIHLLLDVRGIVVFFAAGEIALSRLENVQTGDTPAYTTFYSIGISGFLFVGKAAGA